MANTLYPGKVNSPKTELSTLITATATTVSVADSSKLPPAPNICTLLSGETSETIAYAGITGNDLTGCVRGLQGTAKGWAVGTKIARTFTEYDWQAVLDNIPSAASTTKAGIVQLSDAVSSGATDRAATPNAVKKAYDLANAAETTVGSQTKANTAQTNAENNIKAIGVVRRLTPASNTSLNNATDPGIYHLAAFSNYSDVPINSEWGVLSVFSTGEGYIEQRIISVSSGRSFWRTRSNGSGLPWTTWSEVTQAIYGTGVPEGVVVAPVGKLYIRLDGSTTTTFYVKESGSGNLGWKAK